jgi:hypothetical protein
MYRTPNTAAPKKPLTPKPTSLATEAKKYKTADEFIENKAVMYH